MLTPLSLMVECSRLRIQEHRSQNNRRETSLRAGHIVEIGFLIVAFKGNRDNNGPFRLVINSLVFWMDARVAEKLAAMSMQTGRIKPADSTKRRQVSADGTDRRTKTVIRSQFFTFYSIIIGEVKAVSGSRFWLDSGLDSGADSGVDFVRQSRL
ncbi:hypothetical protein C8J57DRAFT_1240459 [Mycena rebaudengoi]|nr:hypothetical protein C8J57DRAFT_1240459 [Mycena rebaudengoi]